MPPKRRRPEEDLGNAPVQPAGRRQQSSSISEQKSADSDSAAPSNVRRTPRKSASGGSIGKRVPMEARSRVGGEAEGESESTSVCCCCGTDLDQAVHAVAACSHRFCCACLLEQATAIKSSNDGEICCRVCGHEVRDFTLTGGGRGDRSCEMPNCVQNPTRDTSKTPHAPKETGVRCDLLSLPSALLGRLWPPERVVLGLRVCRHLRKELSEHSGTIVLVKRSNLVAPCWGSANQVPDKSLETSFQTLVRDLLRVSHLEVALKWGGSTSGLACVASLGAALTQLDLSEIMIGAEGSGVLAGVLGECKALAHLDLSYNAIGAGEAELALGGKGIGAEGMGRLAGALGECKALVHLDLSGNEIGAEGTGMLAGLLGECKALAHLNLSCNEMGAEGVGILAGVLGECKALSHLDLGANTIGDEGVGRLAGVLGECKALAHLDLSCNTIGAEGLGRLAGVLGECKALTSLDLSDTEIGDEGAGVLAGVLGGCKALAYLSLADNEIGDEGARVLAGVLAGVQGECSTLAHLDLRWNGIGAAGAGRLALDGVKRCKILTATVGGL